MTTWDRTTIRKIITQIDQRSARLQTFIQDRLDQSPAARKARQEFRDLQFELLLQKMAIDLVEDPTPAKVQEFAERAVRFSKLTGEKQQAVRLKMERGVLFASAGGTPTNYHLTPAEIASPFPPEWDMRKFSTAENAWRRKVWESKIHGERLN